MDYVERLGNLYSIRFFFKKQTCFYPVLNLLVLKSRKDDVKSELKSLGLDKENGGYGDDLLNELFLMDLTKISSFRQDEEMST